MRSVLEQEGCDVEYVVVDPGSSDSSRAIVERYRERLACILYDPDDGPADGLNKGFAVATGDVFGFLNADDVLLPGALRSAIEAFETAPDSDIVYGHGHLIDEEGEIIRRFYSDRFSLWRFVHGGVSVLQQSAFFRRQAFEEIGGFNPANRSRWDGELWLDLALAGKRFRLVDQFWSCFRVYQNSITGSGRFRAQYEEDGRRLFEKATGRQPSRLEAVNTASARIAKWALNPVGLGYRILDLTNPRARQSPI